MHKLSKLIIILTVIAALQAIPLASAMAFEDSPDYPEDLTAPMMAVDLILVRPLGIVATVFGGAVFLVSLPFSAAGGNVHEVYDKIVAEPAAFTFKRPLGHDL